MRTRRSFRFIAIALAATSVLAVGACSGNSANEKPPTVEQVGSDFKQDLETIGYSVIDSPAVKETWQATRTKRLNFVSAHVSLAGCEVVLWRGYPLPRSGMYSQSSPSSKKINNREIEFFIPSYVWHDNRKVSMETYNKIMDLKDLISPGAFTPQDTVKFMSGFPQVKSLPCFNPEASTSTTSK